MSFKEVTCRLLVCDGCGADDDKGDFIPHYQAGEPLPDYRGDWYIGGGPEGKDYCEDCRKSVEHQHVFSGGECDICEAEELLGTSVEAN